MKNEKYFKYQILQRVEEAKNLRGYSTYEKFCSAFNAYYQRDIESGFVKALNKDFLFRVFAGKIKFLLSNHRFAKICEFLKIDVNQSHTPLEISKAALMVDELIQQKPELEKQIYIVVQSIANLSKKITK